MVSQIVIYFKSVHPGIQFENMVLLLDEHQLIHNNLVDL